MPKKPDRFTKATGLRNRAEARLRITKHDVAAMPVKDVQRLVYELQIHQIEMEMQNEELRRTQAERNRYLDLYDYAPTGYLTLNSNGMILKGNLSACQLLGATRTHLIGRPVTGFIAAKDRATVLCHLRDLLATGARQGCEVKLARLDDAPVWLRFESVIVPNGEELDQQILTAVWDITERVQQAVVIEKQRKQLEREHIQQEREQLGFDLHDGVLQSLFAIGLNLEASKASIVEAPNRASGVLAQVITDLNSAMKELRTFIGGIGLDEQLEPDLPELPQYHRRIDVPALRPHGSGDVHPGRRQGNVDGAATRMPVYCQGGAQQQFSPYSGNQHLSLAPAAQGQSPPHRRR